MSHPDAFIAWQEAYLGYTEGKANATIFSALTGLVANAPWCDIFQMAAALSTKTPLPPGARSAYTPTTWEAFARAGQTHATPQRGDLGFVHYASLRRIGHVFAVRQVLPGRTVQTVEGNANQVASRTGGQVASLYRTWGTTGGSAHIVGFARPAWDHVAVQPANLPTRADHTGQIILAQPALARSHGGALVEDGELGPVTIRAWQAAMGTRVDGTISRPSDLVAAVQRFLNRAVGARLKVDGIGIDQDGRAYATVRALQGYLGTPRDGVLTPGHSAAVAALQRHLNAGGFRLVAA